MCMSSPKVSAPPPPEPVKVAPPPPPVEDDAAKSVEVEKQKRIRNQAQGRESTIQTSGLGDTSVAEVKKKTLGA